ncbi:MAG: GspE/PulE/PilB domain-containing protein [Myxococcales bacterium]
MTRKLGDILISHGVIDEEKLIAALSDQRAFGGKLGRTLVDLGYVNEDQLIRALSQQLGLPTVDLDHTEVQPGALQCLPVDACERYGVFPVQVDAGERVLRLATAEPDRQTLQELAQLSQYTLEPLLASMSSIDRAIRRGYFGDSAERRAPAMRFGDPLSAIPADVPAEGTAAHAAPNPYAIGVIAPSGGAQDAMQELRTLVIRLEKTVEAQSRAFRALVDLLQDKGVVRRGELGHRTTTRR